MYGQAKKEHRHLVNNTKKNYYQNIISRAHNPTKCAWTIINKQTNKSKKYNITLKLNDKYIECPSAIAEAFNKFFWEAPQNTVKLILNSKSKNSATFKAKNDNNNLCLLYPFSDQEFLYLLNNKLKNKSSSGTDSIPAFLIKKILPVICKPLVFLINLSFCTGKFPSILKTGKIIPIYKKGDNNCLENYRPITNCSVFSKIFEYCFLDRLVLYLNKYKVLTHIQHGFQCKKSTSTAFHAFYDVLIGFIDASESPAGIFCDLSRAFDCVNHDILYRKLKMYGITEHAFDWIFSFVSNRKQYVSITDFGSNSRYIVNSSTLDVNIGVPQGSVIGPVLFLLYLNDIDTVGEGVELTAFADDVSLLLSNKHSDNLEESANDVLANLSTWFGDNSMYLNVDKTQFIRFRNFQKPSENINLNINNRMLNQVKTTKFLGIHIDECLNWKAHCEYVISKLNTSYYLFLNLRSLLCTDQLLMLYYAHVESHLRYGLVFWGVSTLSNNVFIKQKRIIRCIANVPMLHSCRDLFKKYNILPLPCLFVYEMSLFIYINRDVLTKNKDFHNFNTRYKNNLCVQYSRGKIAYNSPNRLGVKIYNALPDNIKDCDKVTTFKVLLKAFLLSNCFYSLDDYFNFSL